MIGTTRTEKAPPVATAVPYSSSQQPGSLAISPSSRTPAVSTMPATSGGTKASANLNAGAADDSGAPERRALIVIAISAIERGDHGVGEPDQQPSPRAVGRPGDGGGDERADAHQDAAPAGHRRELRRPRHRVADEPEILDRVRVHRPDGPAIESFIAQRAQGRREGRKAGRREGSEGRNGAGLLGAEEQHRHLHQVTDAIGGRAEQDVLDEPVAVGRHRDQVDASAPRSP